MEDINQLVVTRQKPFCAHSCNTSKDGSEHTWYNTVKTRPYADKG